MTFERVLDQEFMIDYLKRAWRAERIPHAFLFTGQKGVGKTLTAHVLAMLKFCKNPDLEQVEPCGVCPDCEMIERGEHPDLVLFLNDPSEQQIRIGDRTKDLPPDDPGRLLYPKLMVELLFALQRKSSSGRGKCVLIQNSEKLNLTSANALLKVIEEPPAGTLFVLTSENINRNIGTIISRCHVLRFSDIPSATIARLLIEKTGMDQEQAGRIADLAEGSIARAHDLIEKRSLPVRLWLREELAGLADCDPFDLSARIRELAPGMVHGFDEEGSPLPPPEGSGRTQHPLRDGLRMLFEVMLDFYKEQLPLEPGPAGDAAAELLEDVIRAMQTIGGNVNPEMVVDNLLVRMKERLTGVA